MNIDALLQQYGREIVIGLVGLLLIGGGLLYLRQDSGGAEVQVIEESDSETADKIVVEVSGAVHNPGVYEFTADARVDEALNKAGGFTEDADQAWIEKTINRASKLTDGQKIYIPKTGESGEVSGTNTSAQDLININTASQSELESLWGIGPVYAQSIIEHRPYSSVEELISRDVIKQNVYERNRDALSVY